MRENIPMDNHVCFNLSTFKSSSQGQVGWMACAASSNFCFPYSGLCEVISLQRAYTEVDHAMRHQMAARHGHTAGPFPPSGNSSSHSREDAGFFNASRYGHEPTFPGSMDSGLSPPGFAYGMGKPPAHQHYRDESYAPPLPQEDANEAPPPLPEVMPWTFNHLLWLSVPSSPCKSLQGLGCPVFHILFRLDRNRQLLCVASR